MSTQALWLAAAGAVLGVTVWTDLRSQRIPNVAVAAAALAGMGLSILPGGVGAGSALLGLAVAFVLFLPAWLLGVGGAGDVKLAAALGTFTGFPGVLGFALFTFAAGGLLALLWAARGGALRSMFRNLHVGLLASFARLAAHDVPRRGDMPVSPSRMPYAVAIAIGMAAYVLLVKGLA
ncbi:MAG TPA: A24 family peptidase [Ramlibacter sp.]|uniref:A24 family peptidase n=1 Tax=Ramlibacter sp. TaxID=1917967 RepID=UPI002D7F6297|nr:A24 family peptidase [Ramlibacter sp.]HET8746393.1 A24 family peptidase [Ramlibacter sp.]